MKEIDITQIEGFHIGHCTDMEAGTGCTVIICEQGAVAGVDVRGGGPATRETDLLRPENMVEKIHAVTLSGGSAFGLEASDGVMSYLQGRSIGFETGFGVVPIVCGASLFDLVVGACDRFPDKEMGYEACVDAFVDDDIENGNYGAGTGCTVGKYKGISRMMKSGVGSYAVEIDDLKIGAIVAVNSLGDVFDENGAQIAGLLDEAGERLTSTESAMFDEVGLDQDVWKGNTTIGCIVTNAALSKAQCCKLSQIAHDGIARAIRPVHTSADGDSIFTMACGDMGANFDALGALAAMTVQKAIVRGIKAAEQAYGVESYQEILNDRQEED